MSFILKSMNSYNTVFHLLFEIHLKNENTFLYNCLSKIKVVKKISIQFKKSFISRLVKKIFLNLFTQPNKSGRK